MVTAEVRGGDKLERYLMDLARKIERPASLKVGFLQGASYPNGTSVATVAAIHNFGAPAAGIPARPFFTNAVRKGSRSWGPAITRLLGATQMDVDKALRMMGELIKGDIQEEIVNGSFRPLKPETIRRKGFSTPLIDTSHMINSVDYEVTK